MVTSAFFEGFRFAESVTTTSAYTVAEAVQGEQAGRSGSNTSASTWEHWSNWRRAEEECKS